MTEVFKTKDGEYYLITAFEECPKHGRYISEARRIWNWGGLGLPSVIPYCPACRRIQREIEDYGSVAIPRRFYGKTLGNFVPPNDTARKTLAFFKDYAANLPAKIKAGTSLILFGGVGTGKSHLACALVAEAQRQGFKAMFSSVLGIIQDIRATWNGEGSEREVIRKYSSLDLLVIDEVGVQSGSENERNLLFSVLNGRYENVLPTILISNLTLSEIKGAIGERAFDRLREGGGRAFCCDWGSYRSTAPQVPVKAEKNQQRTITVGSIRELPGMENWKEERVEAQELEAERGSGLQIGSDLWKKWRSEKQVRSTDREGRSLAEVVHAGVA